MDNFNNPLIFVSSAPSALIPVTLTASGTFLASDYGADGFSEVTVNVPQTLFNQVANGTVTQITAQDLAGATQIRPYLFNLCTALQSVSIPDTVTKIGLNAFDVPYNQGGLLEVSFTENSALTTVDKYAFRYQQRLKKFICPSTVTTLNLDAFYNCYACSVILLPTTPPYSANNANNPPPRYFVPLESISDYKAATNWVGVASRILPLVETTSDLTSELGANYTRACVIGNDKSYKEYTYDGSQWNEVT